MGFRDTFVHIYYLHNFLWVFLNRYLLTLFHVGVLYTLFSVQLSLACASGVLRSAFYPLLSGSIPLFCPFKPADHGSFLT
jgi:hypothetical protein